MKLKKIIGAVLMLPLLSIFVITIVAILYTYTTQIINHLTIIQIEAAAILISFIVGGALYFDNESDKK